MKVAQSDSLWPHRLYSPWNFPGQNIGVGSLSLLQGIFPTQGSNPGLPHCRQILYQLSHQGSPRILEWVAYPFSSGSSRPRNWTRVSCIAGRFFINWATREAHDTAGPVLNAGLHWWAGQRACSQGAHSLCVQALVMTRNRNASLDYAYLQTTTHLILTYKAIYQVVIYICWGILALQGLVRELSCIMICMAQVYRCVVWDLLWDRAHVLGHLGH